MRFPVDIYRQLLGTDFRLLDELTYLSNQSRKTKGYIDCHPGRKYLAEKLGVCIRTVSRSIARLKRLGILDATQPRRVRGVWQTNRYKVRHWLGWRMGQLGAMLHRGTWKPREPFCKQKEETRQEFRLISATKLATMPLLKVWLERGNREPEPKGFVTH